MDTKSKSFLECGDSLNINKENAKRKKIIEY